MSFEGKFFSFLAFLYHILFHFIIIFISKIFLLPYFLININTFIFCNLEMLLLLFYLSFTLYMSAAESFPLSRRYGWHCFLLYELVMLCVFTPLLLLTLSHKHLHLSAPLLHCQWRQHRRTVCHWNAIQTNMCVFFWGVMHASFGIRTDKACMHSCAQNAWGSLQLFILPE